MERPTFKDVLAARQVVSRYLPRTPLYHYPSLSDLAGAQLYLKHENHQLLGAFKVRGGVNYMAHLDPERRRRGVITASTGNHGQSVAYASRLFGAHAVIVAPAVGANPAKVESMRNLGAELVLKGKDFDEAREHVERMAQERGLTYIHSANEPLLIAGVGTYALEIMEDLPDVDVIVVPVGGGSGACGTCIVAKAINPAVQVIGVQSEQAPAAYRSWKEGSLVEDRMETFAEGLATRFGFELTQGILRGMLADFVLVSDAEIRRAIVLLLEKAHTLAEGAGAASLAAALKYQDRWQGKKVVCVVSGGNISLPQLREVLAPF
ncbi:MAG: threonine/serine dehydratase [Chloroflexi bacterium]|nr:threonine/serine dehydratase [Chloroflexota bacterium]